MPDFSDTERRLIDLLEVGVKFSAQNLVVSYKSSSRVSRGIFTLPSLRTVLDSLPSHGSSHLTLLFINLYSLLT